MTLKFECPHCQARLSAENGLFGNQIDCPECSQALIVPTPEELGVVEEPVDPSTLKFLCPHCDRRLSAVSHQFGKEMPCPHDDCQKPVLVPCPEWKPIPTTLLRHGSSNANDLVKQAEELTRPIKLD